jgi:hypothetical protein
VLRNETELDVDSAAKFAAAFFKMARFGLQVLEPRSELLRQREIVSQGSDLFP